MRTTPASRRRFLAPLLFASLALAALTAPPKYAAASRKIQTAVAYRQIKSIKPETYKPGKYPRGLVYQDRDGNKVDNGGELKVLDEQNFILTDSRGVERKGKLIARIYKGGYPGGYIMFEGDKVIDIKWTQSETRPERLKIISVRGAAKEFRFCSAAVEEWECKFYLRGP